MSLAIAERNATRDPLKYALLLGQLVVVLFVIYAFKIEGRLFGELTALIVAGFAVHYWLPLRWKKPFFVLLSVAGAYALLHPVTATAIFGAGLLFYGILHLPIGYSFRVGVVAIIAVVCLAFRNFIPESVHAGDVLSSFWPVFGGIFMFRMMIYIYDLRQQRTAGSFLDYLAYFFILPNYYFLLFPIVDYQTMRSTYYNAEFHRQAQEGMRWIARGVSQLLVYRLIYHLRPNPAPDDVTSFGGLVVAMVLTYLLYLRLSGQYHIIIGMMHLFGFNLPETHRRFLFAESFTDFWRRINIYWKDFMVKMVYYPVFFRLRSIGEMKATAVATLIVFGMTWFLHSYQVYWLRGEVHLAWTDVLFWGILGVLVLVNVLIETKARPVRTIGHAPARPSQLVRGVKIVATFSTITVLWSMWNAESLTQWLDMLTYWKIG
jgi:alginate O-acetyltransferase complex protein AlgI